ncbi:MAG: hypothetical protein OES20_17050 [Gammaproteobacteria bacterium]|nr:hypothetical protein [Gammaproteobacteria bacterium]MDH3858522.1 hypothetical protein [Gammaproteobacteria bacterium]
MKILYLLSMLLGLLVPIASAFAACDQFVADTDAWVFDFGAGEAVVNARDSKLNVLLVASHQK